MKPKSSLADYMDANSPEYQFCKQYFSEFNPVGQVLQSYNQVYEHLRDIIQKFNLQHIFRPTDRKEQVYLSIKLLPSKVFLPGENDMPLTSVQAMAQKKDFMCGYEFDIVFTFQLLTNQIFEQNLHTFVDKLKLQHGEGHMIEHYEEYIKYKTKLQETFEIKAGKLTFKLPVMQMSSFDPAVKMSRRQKYDAGLDLDDKGGNIVLNGVSWNIQNGFSYPFNKPIIAKSTITGQVVRADYLYQADVEFGNSYQSIFILLKEKSKEDKVKGLAVNFVNDLVLNFKQRHDFNFGAHDNFIPVSLLFRAYGCKTDTEMLQYCNPRNDLQKTLFFLEICQHGNHHVRLMKKRKMSQIEALYTIGKIIAREQPENTDKDAFECIQNALYGLSKYIYPVEIGKESPYCQTLGEICESIFDAFNSDKFTDRDVLYNKRVVTVGQQIIAELRGKANDSFKKATEIIKPVIQQYDFKTLKTSPSLLKDALENMAVQFSENLDRSIKKSFTNTDNSKIMKNLEEFKSELLSTQQKREIVIKPPTAGGKLKYDQRRVQQAFAGFICGITTPESGANIGRYLSPVIYTFITIPTSPVPATEFITKHKNFVKEREKEKLYFSVKVNFNILGFVREDVWKAFYNDIMKWRHEHSFAGEKGNTQVEASRRGFQDDANQLFTSVYYNIDKREINVMTDNGRIMTPIFKREVVKNGIHKKTMRKMLEDGDALYICPEMANNFVVEEYWLEHEVDKRIKWFFAPLGMQGPAPASVPFINHSNGTRSAYLTSQMKATQEQMVSNYHNVYTRNMLTLNQNQRDVIQTVAQKVLQKTTPYGQQVFMGWMPYCYNQEDGLVVCEDFVERYGWATTQYLCYDDDKQGVGEQFTMAPRRKEGYDYTKVDQSVSEVSEMGVKIKYNDVLIVKSRQVENDWIDQSTVYNQTQEGEYVCVSNVNTYSLNNANNRKVVRLAFGRKPSKGDKITSKNTQKSTIARLVPSYELPYTDEGLTLNAIQNYYPPMKRETYGQILEPWTYLWIIQNCMKTKALQAEISSDQRLEYIHELQDVKLPKLYNQYKNELYNHPIILAAPIVYTVQKHLVDEKIRVRNDDGKCDPITKQPPAGKKSNGGLKIGDMERMAIGASGATNVLKSFYGPLSSHTTIHICKKCGNTEVIYNRMRQQYRCLNCGDIPETDIMTVNHSYNQRLLQHIFFASGVNQKFVE